MLKQIGSFGVLAASLMMASGVHAQEIQSNQQHAVQSGAAVGPYSTVDQTLDQSSYQDMYGNGSYGGYGYGGYYTPEVQESSQDAVQSGAAVGPYSTVDQTLDQFNYQDNSDYPSYPYLAY